MGRAPADGSSITCSDFKRRCCFRIDRGCCDEISCIEKESILMRESEIQLILKWIGASSDDRLLTEEMLRQAIQYAYQMGVTDGRQ